MKIAFLCEGDSEYESITSLLRKFGIGNYKYLDRWSDIEALEEDVYYIYRHNYHGIGKIRKEYLDFSKLLIDAKRFSKVFVWFDNGDIIPVCEYAKAQYGQIGNRYKGRIELVLSVKCLENWFLSNTDVLSTLIDQRIDNNYLNSRDIENFFDEGNVDILNAKKLLKKIKKNTVIEDLAKHKIAIRFFSLIGLNLQYRSDSFSRFLRKMKGDFSRD